MKLDGHMAAVAAELRRRARHGLFNGRQSEEAWRYIRHCTLDDETTQARLMFTRDTGHHSSGWLKNPDYERCWHLSTSAKPSALVLPAGFVQAELDRKTLAGWLAAFFGADLRYVWSESPKSPEGKARGVWHWRLFCDEHWAPILPRKEVYSRDFTPADWRSASQVIGEDGYYRSETEAGGIIESTVDPT
jgi:hypothetical protein